MAVIGSASSLMVSRLPTIIEAPEERDNWSTESNAGSFVKASSKEPKCVWWADEKNKSFNEGKAAEDFQRQLGISDWVEGVYAGGYILRILGLASSSQTPSRKRVWRCVSAPRMSPLSSVSSSSFDSDDEDADTLVPTDLQGMPVTILKEPSKGILKHIESHVCEVMGCCVGEPQLVTADSLLTARDGMDDDLDSSDGEPDIFSDDDSAEDKRVSAMNQGLVCIDDC